LHLFDKINYIWSRKHIELAKRTAIFWGMDWWLSKKKWDDRFHALIYVDWLFLSLMFGWLFDWLTNRILPQSIGDDKEIDDYSQHVMSSHAKKKKKKKGDLIVILVKSLHSHLENQDLSQARLLSVKHTRYVR
jgi:hypothetical protein